MLEVTREDVVEAAERIAGLVERTPLIESEVGGRARLAEMRVPADRRRVQAARRDQPAAAADAEERRARAWSLSRRAIMRAGVAIAARAAGHSGDDRHAVRRAGGEGRRDARRRRRDHLLRPPDREPRGDRREAGRGDAARPWCRASTIRRSSPGRAPSASRSSSSWRSRRRRGIVVPCGGGGLASGIALACPDAEIVCVEPEGWDDMARSLELGEIVPVEPDAPPTPVRRAADAARVADHLRHPARARRHARCRSATPRSPTAIRFAWTRARAGGRAGRRGRRWRRCSSGKVEPRTERWWCCRAGMSIRRCTRGSSAKRLRRRAVLYSPGSTWIGLERSTAGSAPRARRRGSGVRRPGLGDRLRRPPAEASSSVSSIIAMHGRIVSSIRSNASSRRACWSAVAMAAIVDRAGLSIGEGWDRKWSDFSRLRWRVAMIAAFLLLAGGVKLALVGADPRPRRC